MNTFSRLICTVFGLLMFSASYAGPIDINSATAEAIAANLQGIGTKQATAIVEYREQNGPFASVDELMKVKGIGEKTVAKNQEDILFGNAKTTSSKTTTPATATTTADSSQAININTASEEELTALQGIGPAKATAIVKYREEMGPFQTIEELLNVKGIGEKILQKNRAIMSL